MILHDLENLVVTVDEIDYFERLKPSAVLQYFQDIATSHAEKLGIGYERMKSENLFWIINRLSYVVDRYPALGDKIIVNTYPREASLAEAVRDYYITDEHGNSLIRGTSKWCVMDIESKKIKRCKPYFDFAPGSYKTEDAIEDGNQIIQPIQAYGSAFIESDYRVMITDLDRNYHMNNARYGDAILNACDKDFLDKHLIKAMDINFLSELRLGQNYKVKRLDIGDSSYFEAYSDERAVFRAKILWIGM